jgi:hypothetical protein
LRLGDEMLKQAFLDEEKGRRFYFLGV